jgi:Lrp/AsnC family transcriptional regulator, cysteine-sensing transcriptional activator
MDRIDCLILELLQEHGDFNAAEVARRLDLPQTSVWRRIGALEKAGVIKKRVTLLEPDRIGLGATAFVFIRTSQHEPDWLRRFASALNAIPEIVEAHRLSGQTDYLLKVLVPNIRGYNDVYERLIAAVPLFDVSSSFSMDRIKETTSLPLRFALDQSGDASDGD